MSKTPGSLKVLFLYIDLTGGLMTLAIFCL